MIRPLPFAVLLAPLFASTAWPQFTGLATPYDGSVVYFASTLRQPGTNQSAYGKLFVADETGVRLFRSRDLVSPAPPGYIGNCILGSLYSFGGAETSADGRTIAAAGWRASAGECHGAGRATDLISPAGESEVDALVRLSPAGRYAIADLTSGVFSSAKLAFLDLQTGSQTPISLPTVTGPWPAELPSGGRAIANDGTAIFSYALRAYIARPGKPLQTFPVPAAGPLAIGASGTEVLYAKDNSLWLLDLRSATRAAAKRRTLAGRLVSADVAVSGVSDDAQRILFVRDKQAFILQTDGAGPRPLTSDPAGIAAAILSGSGKIVYALTGAGRILKIDADTGDQVEIVGRTPYLSPDLGSIVGGLVANVPAIGLSDKTLQASPPLGTTLGGVTVRIGDRAAPILQVGPTSVSFLVPWDTTPGNARIVVQTPGVNSPFDFPDSTITVGTGPLAGAIAHQNWDGYVSNDSPAHAGEIIHILAVGLGAVNPEVPPGALAPSAEPLARLAAPMTCSDSEVLYAGLAPGYLERIYQVDLRLGNRTGYFQFACSVAGVANDFIFLTLYVVP